MKRGRNLCGVAFFERLILAFVRSYTGLLLTNMLCGSYLNFLMKMKYLNCSKGLRLGLKFKHITNRAKSADKFKFRNL